MLKKLIAKLAQLRNKERVIDPETGKVEPRGDSPLAVPIPKPDPPKKP